ncbi:COP9 signalosome complex subunit 8-like [Liolophura sinensis]|uniref:COP9 signalosome complex subunit 8-like n=1 Tax=Liolophura sinensis TaxID=3198878 RepID=UPI0031594B61
MSTSEEFAKIASDLETQELESPLGVAAPNVYSQLLAIYLLQNEMSHAKFLWKRIPQAVKAANAEMGFIWAVGQKIWLRDFPGIYDSLKKDWSEPIKNIMTALQESTRQRAFMLVSQAYSSISGDDLASFVGLPLKEAIDAAIQRGWEANAQTRMVMPKKPAPPPDPPLPNEQQLGVLTDYVSFLEN